MVDYSEYEGGGVLENTIFPKGPEALTPSDKLRLQSLTGQEIDPKAEVDPYHWYGGKEVLYDDRDSDAELKASEVGRY